MAKPSAWQSPELPLKGRESQCTTCGAVFAGVGLFDDHLIGLFGGCLTEEQMLDKGWALNYRGRWSTAAAAEIEGEAA
jgi:hypothetical protein